MQTKGIIVNLAVFFAVFTVFQIFGATIFFWRDDFVLLRTPRVHRYWVPIRQPIFTSFLPIQNTFFVYPFKTRFYPIQNTRPVVVV